MKQVFTYLLFLIIPLFFGANAGALDIRITGDRLLLHAEQVPLQDILRRLAALGIKVAVDPQINPEITASFEDRDLQQGLDSLLKSLDHVLIWKSISGPSGPIPKLAEIQVFKPGKRGLMRTLDTNSNLSIVKDPRTGSLLVKDEILLRLKPGTDLSDLKRLLREIGGMLVGSHGDLGIYRIRLPENSDVPGLVEKIVNDPRLQKAEPNYAYPVFPPQITPGPAITPPVFSQGGSLGGEVPIAVLDTGLLADSDVDDLVLGSIDIFHPEQPVSDPLGHGTQMALIASGRIKPYGVRPDSETLTPVIAIKAFDDNGFTSNFGLMDSIDFALKNGARVMSLSWGSETRSDFLENALNYAASKGLVVVASAGNEPTGRPVYPAAYPSVIGVGATAPDGKAWENSNHGDFVRFYAPGFATLPVGYKGDPGLYAGTSISAAFVSNLVANVLSRNPEATTAEVIQTLTGSR